MDMHRLVTQIKGDTNYLRVRQGRVSAVNADYTIDVTISGDTNVLPKVKYLGHYAPRLNTQVWILTDGTDMIALGHLAPRSAPVLRVSRSAVQSIPNATDEAVIWTEASGTNPWSMWDNTNNTTRTVITVPIPGYYSATFYGAFVNNTTGLREAAIQTSADGVSWAFGSRLRIPTLATGLTDVPVTLPATALSAGHRIRVLVNQNSGGALDLQTTAHLSVQYLGPVE